MGLLTGIVDKLGILAIMLDEEVVEPVEEKDAREAAPEQHPVLDPWVSKRSHHRPSCGGRRRRHTTRTRRNQRSRTVQVYQCQTWATSIPSMIKSAAYLDNWVQPLCTTWLSPCDSGEEQRTRVCTAPCPFQCPTRIAPSRPPPSSWQSAPRSVVLRRWRLRGVGQTS